MYTSLITNKSSYMTKTAYEHLQTTFTTFHTKEYANK